MTSPFPWQRWGGSVAARTGSGAPMGAVLRAVPFSIPDAEKLHIPKAVMDLFSLKRGMVLVTARPAAANPRPWPA